MKYETKITIIYILSSVLFSYLLALLGYSFSPEVANYGTSQEIINEAKFTSNILFALSVFLLIVMAVIGVLTIKNPNKKLTYFAGLSLSFTMFLSIVSISWFMFAY